MVYDLCTNIEVQSQLCISVMTFHVMLMTGFQNKIWGCDANTIFHAILHC